MIPLEVILYSVLVLMVWSGLYRVTWVFRIAESLIVGLFLGFTIYNGIDIIINRVWNPIVIKGNWINPLWFSVVMGVITWGRFHRSTEFLSRWSLAFLAAIGSALAVSGAIRAQIIAQLVVQVWSYTDLWATLNQIIIFVTMICVLFYFTFSFKQSGAKGGISRLGRLVFMVQLGCTFGTMVMGNFAIPIGIVYELSKPPAFYFTIGAFLIIMLDIILRRVGIELKFPFK